MAAVEADWQIAPASSPPDEWVNAVEQVTGLSRPEWGAQLLWNRGLRSAEALRGFVQAADYKPASPFDFGEEMVWAVERLMAARDRAEKVAIWGDFDADGITSTAVLWDGLRQFFSGPDQLTYFIPNRLKESHGLSMTGLEQLADQGVQLIVTCDTGSTNPHEIDHAQRLGMEVIVTDHHTLPTQRPAVVAIVNPRALPAGHPMAHLSGVAVAYKLVEALYERLPDVPSRPLSELVDLVAIGLIADLVELTGDCRYLAQIGIEQLQKQLKSDRPTRPGVAKLLELCRRAGDRPTDISFGIGPRINAVSRIYGEASFCVELLTSDDSERCRVLAGKAEDANARRKALQNTVFQQAIDQLENRDLSTTGVIVLCDPQWPVGVLGLVAGQVAQQYGRPTILLTLDAPGTEGTLARGSARSVNQIDLYDLVNSQSHLLTGFGGHPFAAGLSLPAADLPMFTAAINQQYRQKLGGQPNQPRITADLVVTVADLGRDLFNQLNLLEPCGMGNPAPRLLIKDCWFEGARHKNLTDRNDRKIKYIQTSFRLCDQSIGSDRTRQFPGIWWGHYKEDLPPGRWDVIAELDYSKYSKDKYAKGQDAETRLLVRLIDIRPAVATDTPLAPIIDNWLLDRRLTNPVPEDIKPAAREDTSETDLVLKKCPTQWQALQLWQHQASQRNQPLVLAFAPPAAVDPIHKWKTLLGLAKYISRAQIVVTAERLAEKLEVSDRTLQLGLTALAKAGFTVETSAIDIRLRYEPAINQPDELARAEALSHFLSAVQEEHFRRQYFYQVPVSTLQAAISAEALHSADKPC